jgi:hypothetical protein
MNMNYLLSMKFKECIKYNFQKMHSDNNFCYLDWELKQIYWSLEVEIHQDVYLWVWTQSLQC